MTQHKTFQGAIRRAMSDRRMTIRVLCDLTGLSEATIVRFRRGDDVPRLATVALLSDALDWPSLVEIATKDRTGACVICGASFVDAGKARRRRYCGERCQRTGRARDARGLREQTARLTKKRLTTHQQAVAAFCKDCTAGDGLCRDDECALRIVSPYAFVPMSKGSPRRAA